MNRTEHRMLLDLHRKQIQQLEAITPGCSSCVQYEQGPVCRLYDDAIPESVAPMGCDAWEFDGIPF